MHMYVHTYVGRHSGFDTKVVLKTSSVARTDIKHVSQQRILQQVLIKTQVLSVRF